MGLAMGRTARALRCITHMVPFNGRSMLAKDLRVEKM